MTVLASGSKGNGTVIACSRTRILVDAGLSARELLKRMHIAGEDPAKLDAVLVTHEHQDHVQGLAVLARKLGIPVFFTEATHRAWMRWMTPQKRITYAQWLAQRKASRKPEELSPASQDIEAPKQPTPDAEGFYALSPPFVPGESHVPGEAWQPQQTSTQEFDGQNQTRQNRSREAQAEASGDLEIAEPGKSDSGKAAADPCALPAVEYFSAGQAFSIGDIVVTPFTIPHDAADPVGFVFEAEGVRVGLATDLGYIPPNAKAALRRCDVLMLESNHDLEMLRDGPYPWPVKQRVMSRVGHLSNEAAGDFLEKNYDGYASYVVLAHLSESNNLPALARVMAERALNNRMSLLANRLLLAEQSQPLPSICL